MIEADPETINYQYLFESNKLIRGYREVGKAVDYFFLCLKEQYGISKLSLFFNNNGSVKEYFDFDAANDAKVRLADLQSLKFNKAYLKINSGHESDSKLNDVELIFKSKASFLVVHDIKQETKSTINEINELFTQLLEHLFLLEGHKKKPTKDIYQKIFNKTAIPQAYLIDLKIHDTNSSFAEIIGFKKSELKGKKILDLIDANEWKNLNEKLELNKDKNDFEIETTAGLNHKLGFRINSLLNIRTVDHGLIISIQETSLLKRAEEIILEREAMLSSIIDSSPDDIFMLNKNEELVFSNEHSFVSFRNNFDFDLKIGNKVFSKMKYKGAKKFLEYFHEVLEGKSIRFDFETPESKQNLRKRYSEISFDPVKNKNGEVIGCLCSSREITDRKKNEIDLKDREAMLNSIIESVPENIIVFNKEMKTIMANTGSVKGFEKNFNVNLKQGLHVLDLINKDEGDIYKSYLQRVFDGEVVSFDYKAKEDEKGDVSQLLVSVAPLRDGNNEIIGAVSVTKDITELKNKQTQLSESEATLKAVLNATPDGIYALDKKYRVIAINKRAQHEFKEKLGIVVNVGSDFHDLVDPEILKSWAKNYFDRVFANESFIHGGKVEIEGRTEYVKNRYAPVKNELDEIIASIEVSTDITEQVIQAKALKKSEEKYKALVNASPAGIVVLRDDRIVEFISERAARIFGYNKEDIINKDLISLGITEKILHDFIHNLNKLKKDEILEFQNKGISKEGQIIYVEGVAKHLPGEQDNTNILLVFNDVTAGVKAGKNLKIINNELVLRNVEYRTILENSFEGIDVIQYDKDDHKYEKGRLLVRNKNMLKFMPNEDCLYASKDELLTISPEFQPNGLSSEEVIDQIIQSVVKRKEVKIEYQFSYNNDERIEVQTIQKMIDVGDKVVLVRNFRNITDSVRQRRIIKSQVHNLTQKKVELEKYISSNLQLENFAYIASHDLKAPLRTVISFAELLKNKSYDQLDTKSRQYLNIVLDSSNKMESLINDLLTYSRVNTQKLKPIQLDLRVLVRSVEISLNSLIKEKKAVLYYDLDMPTIMADESMMTQIFSNLISNAIKFVSPDVSSIVKISIDETKTHWVFHIQDNGIGIKEDHQQRIFKTFEKLHSNDIYEGTGLGLTICQQIAKNHKGKIWVDSKLGEGSRFSFSILKDL